MNKVFISGNLTRDPEVRYSQSGTAYARMGIAVRRPFKSKNSESDQPETDFFDMTAFGKTAEFCGRYLVKGSRVMVEGRIQTGSYEAQDGTKRKTFDIMVENIEFADSKRSDGGNDSGYQRSNTQDNKPKPGIFDGGEDIPEDEIPF